MKFYSVVVFLLVFILGTSTGFSQSDSLTIQLDNVTMEEFVREIENRTKFRFIYKSNDIEPNFSVSIDVREVEIEKVLEVALSNSGIGYNIIDRQIFLVRKAKDAQSISELQINNQNENLTIKGQIFNQQGLPLLGANIVEIGTRNGVTTDEIGNFELTLSNSNPVLNISHIGYENQQIPIEGQTAILVTLKSDSSPLEEVIVVGYGTQRKADLTGAIGSIDGKLIEARPISSPDQLLGGTIAGVNITTWSGDAGAPINVRIRGTGTIGSNTPLWVIDGIPIVQTTNVIVNTSSTTQSNPLAGINPNDIKSIDVLKDAASAAIYGARAANGVIIVTTKRGEKGESKFQYDGYAALVSVRERRDVLNVEQYIDIQNQLGRDFSNFSGKPFINWQDAVYNESFSQNHNLSVSGGNERANYFVSGSYLNQEGVELAQSFERFSLKINSDMKVGRIFKFGQSILISQFDRTLQNQPVSFSNYNASLNAPFFPIYQEGSDLFGFAQESADNLNGISGRARGLNLVARTDPRVQTVDIKSRKVLSNFYGEVQLAKKLKFKTSLGIDYTAGAGDRNLRRAPIDGVGIDQDLYVQSKLNELTITSGFTLGYNNTFGSHSLSALIGFEQTKFRFDKIRLQGRGLSNPNFPATGSTVAAANEADLWTLQGWLGRLNYNYKGKYLLTANVRRDATSRFGNGFRDGVFPSISAGWKVSEEDFFKGSDIVDALKFRISWGQNGNQDTPDSFPYLSTLNTSINYVIGNGQTVVAAPAPVQFANESITWETSTQLDVGFDLKLLKYKLNLTLDYYDKISSDVLLGFPLPFGSGYFLPTQANAGKIKNSGFELSFNYGDKIGDFKYNIGGNITTVKNEVKSLGSITQIISGIGGQETHRTIVGESLGHFYGYKTDGLYQNASEIAGALPDAFSVGGPTAGDIRFVDINGDGQINADDRTILGSPIPGYYYGMNLSAEYKEWDFSAILRGIGNVHVYNQARRGLESYTGTVFVTTANTTIGNNNYSTSVLDRWTSENSTNSSLRPRLAVGDPNGNERYSDRWVENAGYLRIQNVQLGYSIGNRKLHNWTSSVLSNMRIYIGIDNLFTFTKYDGPDPEVTRAQSFQKGDFTLATGQDGGITPQPRVVQLGLSLGF